MKLLVYVPVLTSRIRYIFNFILNDILQTQAGFSSNLAEFKASMLPKIVYAEQAVGDELFFKSCDFLLSHTITPPTIKTTTFGDMIVPFAIDNSSLPFDVFAASFYFVSRYEEYLPFRTTQEGDFPAEASLQNKLKLLEFPVIDGWALMLKNMLLKRYPNLYFGKKEFEYLPLILLYPTDESGLSHLRSRVTALIKRIPFLAKKNEEPATNGLQTFVHEQHEKYKLNAMFVNRRSEEIDTICDKQISLPKSYLQLLKNGSIKDFRMGYTHTVGFRSGTCTPFFWYDLQLEKTTHLLVHTVAINDAILKQHKTYNPAYVADKWGKLIENVKLLNGKFYIIWHQETLAESGRGKSGRSLYAQLLVKFLSLPNDI